MESSKCRVINYMYLPRSFHRSFHCLFSMTSCFRMRRSRKRNDSDATRPRSSGIPIPAPIPICMVAEFSGGFTGMDELVWLV